MNLEIETKTKKETLTPSLLASLKLIIIEQFLTTKIIKIFKNNMDVCFFGMWFILKEYLISQRIFNFKARNKIHKQLNQILEFHV
jgi:hypothetical protein